MKTLYANPYPHKVYLFRGAKLDEVRKVLKRLKLPNLVDFPDSMDVRIDGKTSYNGNDIVVWTAHKNVTTLVHELAHTAFCILNDCGVEISHKNDESFAYLQEFLLGQALYKKGKK